MVSHECLHASPRRSNKKGVSKNECTENSPMSPLAVYLSTSNVPLGSPLSPKMHHMSDWSHNHLVSPPREAGLSPISPMYSHNSPLSAYLSPCKGKRGIDTGSYIATPIRPKLEAMSVSGESAMPPLPSSPMLEQSPSLTYASASGPSLAQISQCLLVGYRWLNHFTLAIAEKSTLTSTSAICLYYLCIGPLDIETIDDDSATSSERRLEKESDGNAHASMCTFFAAYRFITAVTQLYNNVHGGGSQTTRHLFVPSILVFENCVESIRILEMWYREAYNQLLYRPSSKSRGSSTPQTIGSPGTGEVREFTPLEAVLPSFPILDPRTPWGDSLWLEVDLLSASVLPVEYRQELDDLDELIRYPQDGDFARDCSYAKGIKGCRTCGRDNYLIGIYGLSHADVAGGHISENIKQNRLLSDELDLARKEIDTLRLDMTRLRERLYMKDALYQRSVLRRRKQIRRTHGLRVENFDLRRMTQHYEQLIERLRSFSHDYLLNSIPEAASNDYTVKRLLGEFDSIVDHANEVAVKWRGASSMRMDAVSEASCADSIDDFLTKSNGSSCEVSGDVVLPHFAWNPDDNEYDRHNQKLLAHFNDAEALPSDYASASDAEIATNTLSEIGTTVDDDSPPVEELSIHDSEDCNFDDLTNGNPWNSSLYSDGNPQLQGMGEETGMLKREENDISEHRLVLDAPRVILQENISQKGGSKIASHMDSVPIISLTSLPTPILPTPTTLAASSPFNTQLCNKVFQPLRYPSLTIPWSLFMQVPSRSRRKKHDV